ncbi:unnamed protein product [Cylindrotheca closterium]|uniref:HIG1 domain-containing protein n=1 Tax=Cylindrotheca closterium TaxID=2856 RepID=A0AAD2GAQ3_9STRA|nr:unnamed protein product [Cylindrotheca closterium]
MASLTPLSKSDEVVGKSMNEGYMNGFMVFVPSLGAMYMALKNPTFRKVTNVQSRTAMVIMPALFAFAFVSETKLIDGMEELAAETESNMKTVAWAEHVKNNYAKDAELHDLYRKSVMESGVRMVPELTPFHQAANYIQMNPFKCIAGFGVPAVSAIYFSESRKSHLPQQLKILHTRVFGQATVIATLLGIMALKEMMDRGGRYITDEQVEERVEEMRATRERMLFNIDEEAKRFAEQRQHNHDINKH